MQPFHNKDTFNQTSEINHEMKKGFKTDKKDIVNHMEINSEDNEIEEEIDLEEYLKLDSLRSVKIQ